MHGNSLKILCFRCSRGWGLTPNPLATPHHYWRSHEGLGGPPRPALPHSDDRETLLLLFFIVLFFYLFFISNYSFKHRRALRSVEVATCNQCQRDALRTKPYPCTLRITPVDMEHPRQPRHMDSNLIRLFSPRDHRS